jgi:hypothetical protein
LIYLHWSQMLGVRIAYGSDPRHAPDLFCGGSWNDARRAGLMSLDSQLEGLPHAHLQSGVLRISAINAGITCFMTKLERTFAAIFDTLRALLDSEVRYSSEGIWM